MNQGIRAILMAPSVSKNPFELLEKEGMDFKKFNLSKIRLPDPEKSLEKWM